MICKRTLLFKEAHNAYYEVYYKFHKADGFRSFVIKVSKAHTCIWDGSWKEITRSPRVSLKNLVNLWWLIWCERRMLVQR